MRTLFVAALALTGSALFAQQTVSFDRLVLRTHQAAKPEKDDYTVVSFIAQTSDAFDSEWDAYKWGNENGLPNQLPATAVCDFKKWEGTAANLLSVYATPSYFLIDANGKLLSRHANLQTLEQAVAQLR